MASIIFLLLPIFLVVVAVGAFSRKKKRSEKLFSKERVIKNLLLARNRFPISILFTIILFALCFISVNDIWDIVSWRHFIFTPVAIVLGIIINLFFENYSRLSIKTHFFSLFVILLWGIYCFFLPEKMSNLQIARLIELWVISFSIFFSMFWVPFWWKSKDQVFFNFGYKIFFSLIVSFLIGAIVYAGLALALFSIESLFDIDITNRVYENVAIICFSLLAPITFMANIPFAKEKYDEDIFYLEGNSKLAFYVLIPILAIYATILYAYLLKILFIWDLPKGWVSVFVSILALGGLLVLILIHPVRREKNKIVRFIYRWLSVLILPPLILMSIGIFRRIGDYGITVNRGYILLLNIWFYGIYTYLFFTKGRGLKWIFISPAIIALLSSISIWGIANITQLSLTKEAELVLNKKLSFEEAKIVFSSLRLKERDRMASVLKYLYRNFGKESVQIFFTDKVANNFSSFLSDLELSWDENKVAFKKLNYYRTDKKKIWEIGNYNAFIDLNYYSFNRGKKDLISYDFKKDTLKVIAKEDTVLVSIKEIVTLYLSFNEQPPREQNLFCKKEDYLLIIDDLQGDYYLEKDSISLINLNGSLFYKKTK